MGFNACARAEQASRTVMRQSRLQLELGDLLHRPAYFTKDSGYSPAALKLWSTVLVSFAATVTF